MNSMITVERYSESGFDSLYQKDLIHRIEFWLYYADDTVLLSGKQKDRFLQEASKRRDFYNRYLKEFEYGVWVFIEGMKRDMVLDHIKGTIPPCWKAELPDDILVFDESNTKMVKLSEVYCDCFVHNSQLKDIQNIRKC